MPHKFIPGGSAARPTKVEKLNRVLGDRDWHSTRELVRRVGHTFAVAKWKLVHNGYAIRVRRHASKPTQFQYQRLDRARS